MSVEDKLAIQQVIARYSYTFDLRDAEGWANLFTEDGVWEFAGTDSETDPPPTRVKGWAELRRFVEHPFVERRQGERSYHHQSGIIFDELTSDSARTRVMVLITLQTVKEPIARILFTGIYHDQWRKTQEGWRLAHRVLGP